MDKLSDTSAGLAGTPELIAEVQRGNMVIMIDDPLRENEGDLIIPAQWANPEAITFMAIYGRGLICLALEQERAKALNLRPMPRRHCRADTAFVESIDAANGISTGISAADRARTIAVAADPASSPDDLATPGHVFPVTARPGGVLERPGHSEAATDLARLAGLTPAAIICEIMNDDGSMARLPELKLFAARHGLKIGSIADLIAWRKMAK